MSSSRKETRFPGKSLLLSSDNSALVLRNFDRPNLTVKEVANFKEFVDEFEKATTAKQYDNIIVDCLTDLIDAYITEIRENGFGRENIPAMMAAVVVISVPLIVLFLVFRNKIMAGVARGGTKG